MFQSQLLNLFVDQTKDLIWMVDLDFRLVYANKKYLSLVKEITGVEKKLNEPVLVEGFVEEYIEKWKVYYDRALGGEYFEIEEHYSHPTSNEIYYGQIIFEPLTGEDGKISTVVCQSRNITRIVKQKSEANQLMDASLDVFCTVNEQGNFVYVSGAAVNHWGYLPEELIGKPYVDLVLEEDIPKTLEKNASVLKGKDVTFFGNRYKKKDGGVAYNLWSIKWDDAKKLMYYVARDAKEKNEQEEKILQSEQRFKALVQEGSDLIGILDAEGNYKYFSPTSTSILGMEPEEFIGRNALEFIHPEDVKRISESLQKIATENRVTVEPFRFQNHKKEWRWVETVLTNMFDNPAVNGIVANSRDITNKIEEKKKLRAVSSIAKIGYWRLELDANTLTWTDEVYIIWGRQKESFEVNYKNFFSTIYPDDREAFQQEQDMAFTGIKPHDFIHRIILPDKSIKWVHELGRLLKDENGTPIAFEGTVQDITQQKEEEQRLKLLESVITNTNDSILITEAEPFDEPDPKIIYVNQAFTKMTGYEVEDVIGKTPRMLQGLNSNKEELARLSHAIRNWKSCEVTTINYKKNGEEFWVNFTINPVANEKGWYTHWIAIERDVTEQKIKELEKELIAQISINFNTENDLLRAAYELCNSIGKFGKFDLVEVWTANREKNQIHLLSHYLLEPTDQKFYDYSPKVDKYKIEESLVGKVWSQGVQLLWDDIENRGDFVRRDAAKKIGLKSVLGIPLIFHGQTIGVLKIGTKFGSDYLSTYSQVFKRLERFIGSEFNRKKLENDLSHLFDAIPDILCLADFNGRFLKINKAGCELLGYNEAEILYHTFDEFVHPDDKDIFDKEVQRLVHGESTFGFETRYLTKSGSVIWLSWYCNPAMEEGLIYATAKNITEEKKLRELNRQARSLAKIGSWEIEIEHQSLFWSEEVHSIHETDSNSFVPDLKTAINFYREDFRQVVSSSLQNCIADGLPFDFEAVVVTATKKERWVRVIGNAEVIKGQGKRLYGSLQDINSLKESENRLRSLAENLPGVVYQYLIHPDGTDSMDYVAGGVEQLWGFTANEVLANNNIIWNQIREGGDFEQVQADLLKSIQTKSKWTSRFKYVTPTGELRTHLGNGSPLFLADGTILYNAIILDVTQETKMEELLQQASELARIGSWEINVAKGTVLWSDITKQIREVGSDFVPNLSNGISFFKEGESRETITNRLKECIEKGASWDEELHILTHKGNSKWIRTIGKAEMVNGKCVRVYGSLQDIDDKKKSAIKLAESENRFRTILEAEPECIKLLTADGELLMMNPAGLVMIEAENEEQVLGKSMTEILLPEYRVAFSKLTKNVFKGESGKLIFEIEGLKGTRRWLETHAVPMKNEQGDVISLLGVTVDITEQKKSEESILSANERFEKVTEATKDVIWDWDIVNHTFYRSKAIERFFGKDALKSISQSDFWNDKFHPEDFVYVQKSLKETISNPLCSRWELEYRIFDAQGKIIYVIDRGVIIRNKEGRAIRMVGALTDISEQKQMTLQLSKLNESLQKYTAELERSNEELEQFAYVASHDLQEPLRMISSFMDQLKRKYADQLDEKAHQYIYYATDGARRMKQIILNVLEYSRASRQTEGKEEVDMNEILSEFKQLRRKLISEKNAVIKSAYLPTLHTYRAAVTQIFNCLLDNALKYTGEGTNPVVEIKVAENKNEWNFSIKDNGIGIDPQFYDKIFIIFQRLHNKDQYTGTGIGLSIAKRHVEFVGGRIWLESVPQAGTVFYFTIPKI